MAARPHDAGEPSSGDPHDDERVDPHIEEQGTGPGPQDVDRRWQEIVAGLQSSDPRSWQRDPAAEEAEDHFEPPDPGPVLGGDPLLTLAWAAVVGVPLGLLLSLVLWRDMPTLVAQTAAVVFLAGLGLLLWRMPKGGDDGDRGGPGAVV